MSAYVPPCPCQGPPFHDASCPLFDSAHDPAGLASPFAEGSPDDPDRPWRWRDGDEDMRGIGLDEPADDLDVNADEVW